MREGAGSARTARVFTGLVTHRGTILARTARPEGARLVVSAALAADDRVLGASVSVQGVCLTVVDSAEDRLAFDLGFETLARTTLGDLAAGDPVNLEPALRAGDPLGGHLVTGHVDGVGTVRRVVARGEAREVWFDAPAELRPMLAPKGSVCVDGVSLTVNEVDDAGFCVGLVPHTLAVTTLGRIEPGARVNLEADLVARYVARAVAVLHPEGSPP